MSALRLMASALDQTYAALERRGRYTTHHCEDCGAVWPCTDPICDDTPITICGPCVEAREAWAVREMRATQREG